MSRIVIVTFGSLGDLHPAIALAFGLRARGHDAAIATSEPYRAKIEALGLPFHAVRPDLSLSDLSLVRRVMDGQRGTEFLMRDLVYPSIHDMHADLSRIAESADLLVTSELACAAPLVAERQRVRWAYFALSPLSFLSAHDPSVLPGPALLHWMQRRGPAMNRLILRIAKTISYPWWRPARRLRRELGLPPGRSPLFEGKFSPQLNLALFSSVLQPPQPDWPANTAQCGFLFHDADPASAALPAEVGAFLRAGEPPIVFTLGSAAVQLAGNFYDESARAAQILGRRALLLLGKNPPPPGLPASIFAWDYLPYSAVFPHAAAVVHQGGVGTTAQTLRAGRPMIIVPFAHDQFDNVARIERLGVGRSLARARYSAATIAAELKALLTSDSAARAETIGETLRAERGVERACEALEGLLDSAAP